MTSLARENTLPSGGVVDAMGRFGFDRAGMTMPMTTVSDVFKQNEENRAYEPYRKEWRNAKNDPASFVYGKQRQEKKKGHWGYTPTETGSYVFVLTTEGAGTQVLGVAWYGPKATVIFKGLSTHLGSKAELKYHMDMSNNRLWFRSVGSLLECKRIEVHVTLETIQPLYFFPCYNTTPIFKMFNTGAIAEYHLAHTTRNPLVTSCPWDQEPSDEAPPKHGLGHELYEMRNETGDLALKTCDGEELKMHKAILLAKSHYFKTCQLSAFKEANSMMSSVVVEGPASVWRHMLTYIYMEKWMEHDGVVNDVNDFDLLIVCDLVDYYGFPEGIKKAAIDGFVVHTGNMVPASIYAWNNRNVELLEKLIMFWGDNADIFIHKKQSQIFVESYNAFLAKNLEFEKALKRMRFDWNGETTDDLWTKTMLGCYHHRMEIRAVKRQRME